MNYEFKGLSALLCNKEKWKNGFQIKCSKKFNYTVLLHGLFYVKMEEDFYIEFTAIGFECMRLKCILDAPPCCLILCSADLHHTQPAYQIRATFRTIYGVCGRRRRRP